MISSYGLYCVVILLFVAVIVILIERYFWGATKNRCLYLRFLVSSVINEGWRPNTRRNVFPGNLSRCRASHLSLNLITPIHFTGLTCIFCIWNKIHAYNPCCYFYYIGAWSDAPLFLDGTMSKFALILLGIGLIFALIIIMIAIVDEYLHGHDSWLLICTHPMLQRLHQAHLSTFCFCWHPHTAYAKK